MSRQVTVTKLVLSIRWDTYHVWIDSVGVICYISSGYNTALSRTYYRFF